MLTIQINDLLELSKYTNILKSEIQTMTPAGLKKIFAVDITAKNSKILNIKTSKHELSCSPDHLIKSNNEWIKVKDLKIDQEIDTKYGTYNILSISELDYTDDLLDLHVDTNEYYTNDILSHNSSLISSLDLACYGEELNKRGKRLSKGNFPNRINGDMEVGVIFNTDQELYITRKMVNLSAPVKTNLVIDKIPYNKANKIEDKIVEKIGFDFKTYKSFISMNVNNFKNFISLTPEEKRILLDKLFNLEQINELNKILKELQKTNSRDITSLKSQIDVYLENISELQSTVDAVLEKNKNNNYTRLSEISKLLIEHKSTFLILENLKDSIQEELDIFSNGINKLKTKKININRDIIDIETKIELYSGGKCPTCLHDLSNELNLLPELQEVLNKTKEVLNKTNTKINDATIELQNCTTTHRKAITDLQLLTQQVNLLQQEQKSLKSDKNNNIEDFKLNIKSLETKKEVKEVEYLEIQKLKYVYDILTPIWGEQGIKRDIIDSIIDPLNEFIEEDLIHLKTRFRVQLDNNFDAHIYEWNEEIDTDTLSVGEEKKINLIIMLAYIKMLRMKRNINVLFLDEVFASIDMQGIEDILILFKKFANERKINIFLVHHSELNEYFFDRILYIKKNTFSYIEEKII
jgi:DNA repair exonuclease SbcCD ATPase subunit